MPKKVGGEPSAIEPKCRGPGLPFSLSKIHVY